ncbi:MAG: mechanosensitive ion channel domain-containing protein [Anaerolineales bacterium]
MATGDFGTLLRAFLDAELVHVSGTTVTIATALTALLVIGGSFLLSRLLRRGIKGVLVDRRGASEGPTTTALNLLHYFILVVGFAIALQTIGIEIGSLFTAGAVFAVGLGFAMQNIAQNFVAGVILLTEQSIRTGDVLEVEGTVVKVQQTGIRATIVRSRDGEELIVPNATLVQSTVRNFTLKDSSFRLRTTVGVSYESDLSEVRKTLQRVADELPWRSPDPGPQVLLSEFGNSSVIYDVAVWMRDPWRARRRQSDLNESIWLVLQEKGIRIAFPQLDVHFDGRLAEDLKDQRTPSTSA